MSEPSELNLSPQSANRQPTCCANLTVCNPQLEQRLELTNGLRPQVALLRPPPGTRTKRAQLGGVGLSLATATCCSCPADASRSPFTLHTLPRASRLASSNGSASCLRPLENSLAMCQSRRKLQIQTHVAKRSTIMYTESSKTLC